MSESKVTYKNIDGHWEFKVDGIFECSCDTNEFSETLRELEAAIRQ